MAYTKAQREEIALSNGAFQRQVGGCLFTHARYLYDVSRGKQDRDPDETAIVLSVVANVEPFVVPMSRAVLHYRQWTDSAMLRPSLTRRSWTSSRRSGR